MNSTNRMFLKNELNSYSKLPLCEFMQKKYSVIVIIIIIIIMRCVQKVSRLPLYEPSQKQIINES